ncbi:hypothetical protein [Pelagerythrobacter marinus]|uniref:hypothetical protein n=1 Tax=Pelagerythrobacter marinus TaxID=538382 RepID=UPI002AC8DC0C|nr:hypothetical protein [Pelagerythrobacter marinus]WPZ05523.1 hypothetical protein T8T98_08760 [Pelagerythrobacter marinus]
MIYKSSKGPVEIAGMPLSYAKNALNKLRRTEPERTAEIDALDAHVSKLETEATEEKLNPRAQIGGNNPPPEEEIKPEWEAVKVHMDDLLTEAENWADGEPISKQEQADKVSDLRRMLQEAARLADKARVAEKKPYDDAIAEIQGRYNEYIAPLKNKKPGSVSKADRALANLLTPWLNKLDEEKRERERKAKEEADAKQAAALAAREQAKKSDDLSEMDKADDLLAAAEEAAATLKVVEREKPQAKGAFRASGLRSVWTASLNEGEGGKALVHYAKAQPDRVKAFLQQLADEDVRRGVREIPGFTINKTKVAA